MSADDKDKDVLDDTPAFSIELDGQTLTGESTAELQTKVSEFLTKKVQDTVNADRMKLEEGFNAQIAELRKQIPAPAAGAPAEWDQEGFARSFVKDARKAIADVLQDLYGYNPVAIQKAIVNDVLSVRGEIEAGKFLRDNPDFEQNLENSQNLDKTLRSLGLPPNAQGMRAAWTQLKADGQATLTKPVRKLDEPPEPPPAPGGRTSKGLDTALKSLIDGFSTGKMTSTQYDEGLRKLGML